MPENNQLPEEDSPDNIAARARARFQQAARVNGWPGVVAGNNAPPPTPEQQLNTQAARIRVPDLNIRDDIQIDDILQGFPNINFMPGDVYTKDLIKKVKKDTSVMTMQEYWGIKPIRQAVDAMTAHQGQNIFGVELEIENFPVHVEDAQATGFKFVTDGSLRGQAVEAIAFPNSKIGILAVVNALWSKYNITENNFSERTSIHVHANVLDWTDSQIRSLILVYSTIEDLLFEFIGGDRSKNIFCVPWSEAGVNAGSARGAQEAARRWQKYTALNLAPIRTQGTVEWRHMEGHSNFTKLQSWLNIIDDVMSYCKKNSTESITDIIQSLNNTSEYAKWATNVIPSCANMFTHEQIRAKLARGVIEAKIALL